MDVVGVSSMRRKRLEDNLRLVLQRLWPENDVSEAQLKQLDDDDVSDEQSDASAPAAAAAADDADDDDDDSAHDDRFFLRNLFDI